MIDLLEKAQRFEEGVHHLFSLEGVFAPEHNIIYSVCEELDDDLQVPSVTFSEIAEGGDIYQLLGSTNVHDACRVSDCVAVLTSGWASPADSIKDCPPSQHPDRRRVRLICLTDESGMASVIRFSDDIDNPIVDAGTATGSLADALQQMFITSKMLSLVADDFAGFTD